MSTIVTRAGKGSALTHTEVDANFTNLNTDKIQSGNTVASLTVTSISGTTATYTNAIISSATITGGTITGITDLAVADGGTGASDASGARTNLGLGTIATQASSNVSITGGAINGTTVGATTPSTGSFTSLTDSGNLTFTGTGNRITGDFSNATLANRVMFQSGTTNGFTVLSALPNGTATTSGIRAYNNSDLANNSNLIMSIDGTLASIQSQIVGTGTYLPMTFYTGGSERMRVDTSGNVGIGTSSPGSILELNKAGSGAIGPNLYLENSASSATGNASRVSFGIDAGASAASPTAYIENVKDAAGPGSSYLAFGTFGASLAERLRIDSSGNVGIGTSSPGAKLDVNGNIKTSSANPFIYSDGPLGLQSGGSSPLAFYTSGGTERARIDSSGRLLVNSTSDVGGNGPAFSVNAEAAGTFANIMEARWTGTGSIYHLLIRNGNGLIGGVTSSGSTTAFLTSSDYRLKEDVQPMTGALARVAALKPVTYKWKVDGADGEGFIAHELAEVVPDAVTGEKDAVNEDGSIKPQGIDTSFLVATLTAAIQEQQAMIEELKAKVAALEEK